MNDFPGAIKIVILTQLTAVLKPLIDKWNKELKHGSIATWPGLEMARNDIQEIIDKANERIKAMKE